MKCLLLPHCTDEEVGKSRLSTLHEVLPLGGGKTGIQPQVCLKASAFKHLILLPVIVWVLAFSQLWHILLSSFFCCCHLEIIVNIYALILESTFYFFSFNPHNNSDRSGSKYNYLCFKWRNRGSCCMVLPNVTQLVSSKIEIGMFHFRFKSTQSTLYTKIKYTWITDHRTLNYRTSRWKQEKIFMVLGLANIS